MPYRAAKGMNDILPDEIGRWQLLESTFRRLAELQGYREVRTPFLEPTELFVRSVGETTDIVQKEMFTFQHHKDSLTLRPEGTASAVRAYIQHSVQAKEPVTRWYYIGPMFRAERPQRGRHRQFFQAGCELFGDPGPAGDAEQIAMLHQLYEDLRVPDVEVCINSLGGPSTRDRYRDVLREHLAPNAEQLSEASQRRLADNPLRILDSKSPDDQKLVADAPSILDLLEDDDRAHFEELRALLERLGVPFVVEPGLVRGLDYYSRTLFEIRSSAGNLGAQNAITGGGRYDSLVKRLGGPDVPAFGFAIGLDRVLLAMEAAAEGVRPRCYVAPLGPAAMREGVALAKDLRARGVPTDLDGRGTSLKSMLRRADSLGARVVVILGEDELEQGVVQVKDLDAKRQQLVARDAAVDSIVRGLGETDDGPLFRNAKGKGG